MTSAVRLLLALSCVACAADPVLDEPASDPGGGQSPSTLAAPGLATAHGPTEEHVAPVDGDGDGDGDGGDGDLATRCREDGAMDFHVFAEGLASAWEGRLVVAAAFENTMDASKRVVWLPDRIADGRFSLYCPRPLTETYWYPSYGVYVDRNDDGRCSAGDAGFQMQLYGWNEPVNDEIPSDLGIDWMAVEDLGPPIGSSATTFCAGYFE